MYHACRAGSPVIFCLGFGYHVVVLINYFSPPSQLTVYLGVLYHRNTLLRNRMSSSTKLGEIRPSTLPTSLFVGMDSAMPTKYELSSPNDHRPPRCQIFFDRTKTKYKELAECITQIVGFIQDQHEGRHFSDLDPLRKYHERGVTCECKEERVCE